MSLRLHGRITVAKKDVSISDDAGGAKKNSIPIRHLERDSPKIFAGGITRVDLPDLFRVGKFGRALTRQA